MDTACEIDETQQSLIKRIYYMARDGMGMALYNLLSDKSETDVNYLINQVNRLRHCVIRKILREYFVGFRLGRRQFFHWSVTFSK